MRKQAYVRNRLAEQLIKETIFKKHLTCGEHEGLEKVYFCDSCKVPVCPECWFASHLDHKRKILKQVYEERRKDILEALEPFE